MLSALSENCRRLKTIITRIPITDLCLWYMLPYSAPFPFSAYPAQRGQLAWLRLQLNCRELIAKRYSALSNFQSQAHCSCLQVRVQVCFIRLTRFLHRLGFEGWEMDCSRPPPPSTVYYSATGFWAAARTNNDWTKTNKVKLKRRAFGKFTHQIAQQPW